MNFLVLINGSPFKFFDSSRGLQQEDLLFILLFVIVMEALSRMMFATMDRGLLSGFLVGLKNFDEILVSHFLFVNDTLIFYEANLDHFRDLLCLFLCFEVTSVLKINISKSKLVPVGAVDNIGGLARILGCRVSSLPMKYLVITLGALYKTKSNMR